MVDQCSLYSCYGTQDGHFNISDGCSLVPDILLNYDSCVIHDLCYITPGVTKQLCDRFMEENMNTIYCDNVNRCVVIQDPPDSDQSMPGTNGPCAG